MSLNYCGMYSTQGRKKSVNLGAGYIQSHIFVFCPSISFEISCFLRLISKEISQAEYEYMNMHPPPLPQFEHRIEQKLKHKLETYMTQ